MKINLPQRLSLLIMQCVLTIALFSQTPPPKQWDKRFGGASYDELYSLQQTADGGYILGGWSQSGIGGDKTEESWGGDDYWVVKIDANGVKQWDKRFGGTTSDHLHSLQQTADGGYILGGYSYSDISGDITVEGRGYDDYWIVKTGPEVLPVRLLNFKATKEKSLVNLSWQTASESNTAYFTVEHAVNAIIFSAIGNVTAAGNNNTLKDYQFIHTDPQNGTNFYRLKMVDADGKYSYSKTVSVSFANGSGMVVYPNPSKGVVTILYNSKTTGDIQLNIFDASGRKVFTKPEQAVSRNNVYQLNLSKLTPGIYNLQLSAGSEKSNVKFVIEK